MNKRFLSLAVSILVVINASAFAQIKSQVGVVAGLSMYSEEISGEGASQSSDTKTGFVGGIVIDFGILNLFSIEPGVLYSMRGGQSTYEGETFKHNLSYLAIPVHAKLKWPGLPIVSPYALAGVNLAYLLSANQASSSGISNDFASEVNSVSFGIDFGAGLEFDLPVLIPYLEFVYDLGLTNIAKNIPSDASIKTSGSELRVGIRFNY
jgi:opacity protein-like surface antigen